MTYFQNLSSSLIRGKYIFLIIFPAVFLIGCSQGLDAGRQTLTNVIKAADAGVQAFESFDKAHQEAMVKQYANNNPLMLQEAIKKYRTARDPVMAGFAGLRVLTIAATALITSSDTAKIQATITSIVNSSTSLASALQALGSVGL